MNKKNGIRGELMETLSWWVDLIIAGIVFCGYMTIRTTSEEQDVDQSFIEHEGEIYIERMNHEIEKRKALLKG
jgi:hypothetical protein